MLWKRRHFFCLQTWALYTYSYSDDAYTPHVHNITSLHLDSFSNIIIRIISPFNNHKHKRIRRSRMGVKNTKKIKKIKKTTNIENQNEKSSNNNNKIIKWNSTNSKNQVLIPITGTVLLLCLPHTLCFSLYLTLIP